MTDDRNTEQSLHESDAGADSLARISDTLAAMGTRLGSLAAEIRAVQDASQYAPRQELAAGADEEPAARNHPEQTSAQQGSTRPRGSDESPSWQDLPRPPLARSSLDRQGLRTGSPQALFERLGARGFGSKMLAWLGGAVTLAGVVLLLVLAVQRGWIGPLPRVSLGAVLGLTLVGIGVRLGRTPPLHRDGTSTPVASGGGAHGAFALVATGFAVLYLDIVAATAVLDLIPRWSGLALGLAVALAGLGFAARWNSERLSVFVLTGVAVCAPVLTAGFTPLLLGFLIALSAGAAPVNWTRGWSGALLAAGLPPLVAATLACLARWDEPGRGLTLAILVVASAAAVAAMVTGTTAQHGSIDMAGVTLLGGLPAPAMLTGSIVDAPVSALLIGGLALLVLALWACASGGRLPADFTAVSGAAGGVLALHATIAGTGGDVRVLAILGQTILLSVLATRTRAQGMFAAAGCYGTVGTLFALSTTVRVRTLVDPYWPALGERSLLGAVACAVLLAVAAGGFGYAAARLLSERGRWGALVPAGVIALYGTTGVVVFSSLLLSPDRVGFLAGHAVVTVSWTVAALVLLVRGIERRALRMAGFVLVGSALAKLVLFDLASLDGVARVAAFLGAGIVLLAAGVRYAHLVATHDRAEVRS